MKLTTKFFFGAMALTLVACSNEIPGVDEPSVDMTGKTAYMKINITSVGDLTRATEDKGFAYDNEKADEHAVHDAQFFFFDDNGLFVTKATVWTGGKDNPSEGQNVEYMGNNVIVLKNLTSTPLRYMLTVLNLPDFQPSNTIEATATQLQNYYNNIGGTNYHVMSTSSYFGTNAHHSNKYPYATFISTEDYRVQPADADFTADDLDKVVDVYVERLAAKVQVELADDFTSGNQPVTLDDGTVLYPIRASVSGYNNGTLDDVEDDDTGAEMLYVKFTGWGLNSVLPASTLFKQLNSNWIEYPPFNGWNDEKNYRSYWTQTPYYGRDPNEWLSYICFKDANTQIGDKKVKSGTNYCNGNTNTTDQIFVNQSLIPSKVTNVLVAAQICNKWGEGLDLIRATSGEMYTKQSYINYIFSIVNPQIFTKDDDGQGRTQITPADLELDWELIGKTLRIAVKGVKSDKTFYDKNDQEIQNPVDYISGAFNNTQSDFEPEAYNGGAMYYSIPIEHMAAVNAGEDVKPYLTTGYYGVVRNFWYIITLNNLTRFGHGVFDPENEQIIPESPDDQNYLLGAKINILSWKVLNQSVNM